MTSIELKDWCIAHGCILDPFEPLNGTIPSIRIKNPNTRTSIYLTLPLSETYALPDKFVIAKCNELGIPIPTEALKEKQ
jgi:hypothetical protein